MNDNNIGDSKKHTISIAYGQLLGIKNQISDTISQYEELIIIFEEKFPDKKDGITILNHKLNELRKSYSTLNETIKNLS